MAREAYKVHRLTDREFQMALAQLHLGHIPENMREVYAHVQGTIKELLEYNAAITECAYRLNNNYSVLEDILEKAGVRYEKTPDGPRKIINEEEQK